MAFGDPLSIGTGPQNIEITIPLDQLGAMQSGDRVAVRIVNWDDDGEWELQPDEPYAVAEMPEI